MLETAPPVIAKLHKPGNAKVERLYGLYEATVDGKPVCFVGSEFPVQVGGRDFALDMLFLHRGFNCLVARSS